MTGAGLLAGEGIAPPPMLFFAYGGARLIPEPRFLRTELPRRLPRGECAEALGMVAESGPEGLPAPECGEGLAAYIRRAILDTPEYHRSLSSARGLGFDVTTPLHFRPAFVTSTAVTTFYDTLARSDLDPRDDHTRRLLNHLWKARHPRTLPLYLRMLDTPDIDLGDGPPREPPRPGQEAALHNAVKAGRLRDDRLTILCSSLKSGEWLASGFLPGDVQRAMVTVPAAWWADEAMQCHWATGELRPLEQGDRDRPRFLGLTLSVNGAESKAVANIADATVPKPSEERHVKMRGALSELLREREGRYYSTKAEAYRDVLLRLGMKDPLPRGYSIDRFADACADLLNGTAL